MKKVKETHIPTRENLKTLNSTLDLKKPPLASSILVSFQNYQWVYVQLQNTW
jgi:hypothetical protein